MGVETEAGGGGKLCEEGGGVCSYGFDLLWRCGDWPRHGMEPQLVSAAVVVPGTTTWSPASGRLVQ